MNRYLLIPNLLFGLLLTLFSGCSHSTTLSRNSVKETFLHRYGVAISRADWEAAGRTGNVISTLSDGVTVNRAYREGSLEGDTTYTFPHSETIAHTISYAEGQAVREVWNYPSGMPEKEGRIEAPDRRFVTTWYESGIPKSLEEYDGSRLIRGDYHNQSNESESKISEGTGTRVDRDGWGQLVSTDDYQEGLLVSITSFHPNGSPNAITPFKEGLIEGLKRTFHPSGEPATIEEWQQSQQHGLTTVFKNGEKAAEIPYVEGKQHGTERHYRDNDLLVAQIAWVGGHRHGPTKMLIDGEETTEYYHRGKLVSEVIYRELNSHLR